MIDDYNELIPDPHFVPEMNACCGLSGTILSIYEEKWLNIKWDSGDSREFFWHPAWVELIETSSKVKESSLFCNCGGGYKLNVAGFKVFKVCTSCGKEQV